MNRIMYELDHPDDRILKLKVIDGTKPKTASGNIDPRLFTGENNLHAMMDSETTLWRFRYDHGVLPVALKQEFTSFNKLLQYATAYLATRNLEVSEVIRD